LGVKEMVGVWSGRYYSKNFVIYAVHLLFLEQLNQGVYDGLLNIMLNRENKHLNGVVTGKYWNAATLKTKDDSGGRY
jgi:hypothetical protein